jgi:hypothetical protein
MVDETSKKTKSEMERDDQFVNRCQFEKEPGKETAQEKMAEAKARAELERQDVKGECPK